MGLVNRQQLMREPLGQLPQYLKAFLIRESRLEMNLDRENHSKEPIKYDEESVVAPPNAKCLVMPRTQGALWNDPSEKPQTEYVQT